ncbi:ABC transporter permease [Sebaldella sp. S0638]|uniref:ABC transporter permease n=1 Tax=Sebaldella sp. S0638 TaxID=2957809 RepID=UPI00209E0E58|nr:ABC transporter permease [Sebaldella sp. S0638]MCP1226079.1 ABC transporter permease [Sebaldella sp. S0638]
MEDMIKYEKKATNIDFKKLMSRYGIYLILLFMIVVISMMRPVFLSQKNLLNVVRQVSVIGLISLGVTLAIIAKGIDLSSGSVLALAGVIAASLAQTVGWAQKMYPGLGAVPVIVPIIAALAVGSLCGLINGGLIATTGIPPFIATLGMMVAARGAALLYTDGRPVSSLTPSYQFIGQGYVLGIPVPVLIYLVMIGITWVMLNYTRFGKNVYAIGGNINAAEVSGVKVKKNIIMIYLYAGLLAGLAGLVLTARVNTGQPGMGVSYELDAIAATTIGGTSHSGGIGTIGGAFAGALILGVLNNGLDLLGVSAYWQQIIKGAIIVGAVVIDMRKHAKKA